MRTRVKAQLLSERDRSAALRRLASDPRANLHLMDLVSNTGRASPHEMAAQAIAAWEGNEVVGVASMRPSMLLDARMDESTLAVLLPYLESVEAGLIKSPWTVVTPLWERLSARGRRALIDRVETAYAVEPGEQRQVAPIPGAQFRHGEETDLESLVHAARASLREEDRPDPFDGDPAGFRRWVRSRLPRARVVEVRGEVVFVGYADVRRKEGWLIQGVYTWPDKRRSGYGRLGMAGLIDEAFRAGAAHVQLAVVEGNTPAIRLYEGLGFSPFSRLRTLLFG